MPLSLQVPGDVLQSIPSNPAACQPLHQPLLHDAGLWNAWAAVIRWHRLHPKDPGAGQDRAGGPRLLHEADERCPPWWLDDQDGLDLPHNPTARHELKWQPVGCTKTGTSRTRTETAVAGSHVYTPWSSCYFCHCAPVKHYPPAQTSYIMVLRKAYFRDKHA